VSLYGIWSGSAYDEGAEAAEWFSAYLGKPSRLVRFKEGSVNSERSLVVHGPSFLSLLLTENACLAEFLTASETRPTDPDYAQGYKVMFADAFPILIASQVVFRFFRGFLQTNVFSKRFCKPAILWLLQGSLDALNKILKEPVQMNRFRAK